MAWCRICRNFSKRGAARQDNQWFALTPVVFGKREVGSHRLTCDRAEDRVCTESQIAHVQGNQYILEIRRRNRSDSAVIGLSCVYRSAGKQELLRHHQRAARDG